MSVGDNYDDAEDKGVYVFSSPEEVVKNNCGWCWDVANLIKAYCDGNHIENKCVFLEYRSPELHQTHTQVFVSYNGKWCEAPDNSSPLSLGDSAYEEAEVCIRNFAEMFTDYLKSVLGDKYDKACLMIRECAFLHFQLLSKRGQKSEAINASLFLAQRKGFEPLDTFLHHTISNRARSTAPPSLQNACIFYNKYGGNATLLYALR